MATKMPKTRATEKQKPGAASDQRATKGMSGLGCSRVGA
jgi:hypothetical protein